MKKNPGEKPARDKVQHKDATAGERKMPGGKPNRPEGKKHGKEPPKPFNNPFAEALRNR
jgi:hypothetical protein